MAIHNVYAEKIHYFNDLGPHWDETVGNDRSKIGKLIDIFKMIPLKPGYTVLDVGCGNGILFRIIEEKIGSEGSIHAVDPAESMIDRARLLHRDYQNITYYVGLIEEVHLSISDFDAILCFSVFPHLEDKREALRVMRGLLKQDGKIYIFHLSDTRTLNEFHGSLDAPVKHDYLPDREEMGEILGKTGFSLVSYIDRPGLNFIEIALC
jgi:ubiquinone/menaquinone biosynthesis C-methylase UbiE